MPHSSGGGSHGGGSHGGHSSHSSGGSSYASTHRVGRKAFSGASRYCYYQNSRPVYVYANYDITKPRSPFRYLWLIIFVPIIIFEFVMLSASYQAPSKLNTNYDTEIHIVDSANVLENETQIRQVLNEFYDKTGITPAILTVYNEDWDGYYADLEYYAYDVYVNSFDDEKHWLIVYSEEDDNRNGWVEWYWEGMQGDDTDSILTEGVTDKFTESLQKYLTAASKYSINEAIINAFNEITPTIMDKHFDFSLFIAVLVFIIYTVGYCYVLVFRNANKCYEQAQKISANATEQTCDYCGGIYVVGTCLTCPHCGAGVKPREA